jgi:hypothetical protein
MAKVRVLDGAQAETSAGHGSYKAFGCAILGAQTPLRGGAEMVNRRGLLFAVLLIFVVVNPAGAEVIPLLDNVPMQAGQNISVPAVDVSAFNTVSFLGNASQETASVGLNFIFSAEPGALTDPGLSRSRLGTCGLGGTIGIGNCQFGGHPIQSTTVVVEGPFLLVRVVNGASTGAVTIKIYGNRRAGADPDDDDDDDD